MHYILITFANKHAHTITNIEHEKVHANTRAIGVHYTLIAFANTRATIAHKIVHMHTHTHTHTIAVRAHEAFHRQTQEQSHSAGLIITTANTKVIRAYSI